MSKNEKMYDSPDSASSVGWIKAKVARLADEKNPFRLQSGRELFPVDVEYECYGKLSRKRDNVVLIGHALSGDAHAAGWDKNADASGRLWRKRKPGWWDSVIGPGKALDTNKYFIICSNYLGSCYGTTGPSSVNPATGQEYGISFPVVTVSDWTRLQKLLLDQLGIERIYAVIGGSLGGQQALEWALAYPDMVDNCVVLAAAARLSTQGVAFNAVGRYSIMNDPNFAAGDYYHASARPHNGLAAARMLAHITYLSDEGMIDKFGRRLQDKEKPDFGFGVEFAVESYLDYQGRSFVERFDANSYLYITRAMDYYDAAEQWGEGDLVKACGRTRARMLLVSFSSDWLYSPADTRKLALAFCRCNRPVSLVEVPSSFGHDAFLVEAETVGRLLKSFLAAGK
jgi:homoserine O-acetyltransferase